MLEVMNKTQQTVAANNIVLLNTVTISDRANRMNFSNGAIQLNFPGKYNIEGYFGLYNSTSAAVNTTIQMYANGVAIDGASFTVTVPATGYAELILNKTVNVISAPIGNKAKITFISSTGATIENAIVDVYKRS